MPADLFGKLYHWFKTGLGGVSDPFLQFYGCLFFILHMKDQPQGLLELVCPIQIWIIILNEFDLVGLIVGAVFRVMSKGMF